MKDVFISDLKKNEIVSDFQCGISKAEENKDKNGKSYFVLDLIDKTGFLKAKIWNDKLASIDKSILVAGNIVDIAGVLSEYRGELQIVIQEISVTKSQYDLSDFIQGSKFNPDEQFEKLKKRVDTILNKDIYSLLSAILKKYETEIKTSPAAEKLHHAYRGGLLDHLVEMFGIMDSVKVFYSEANYEIITAGIILHDLGKIRELELDGFNIIRTVRGRLLGHLIISLEIFLEECPNNFDKEIKIKIEHIILSHHGLLEYGSPVVPKTIEAIILHKIDDLSSNVRQYKRVLDESSNDQEFSKKDWALGTEVYLN